MGGDKPAGRFRLPEGDKTRKASVIIPAESDAGLAGRARRFRDADQLVAPFHENRVLRPDFLSGRVIGDQDFLHLAGIVLLVMQGAAGAAGG